MISFEEFLKSDIQKQQIEPIIPMDLDSQNPAVHHRLIKNSARRVIKQHKKEIEALKDK